MSQTIQGLQKDLKWAKTDIKTADNSTCLHWDSFEINTRKPEVNESFIVDQLREIFFFRVWPKICQTDIIIICCRKWSAFVTVGTVEELKGCHCVIKGGNPRRKDDFQQLLQGETTRINELQKTQVYNDTNLSQVKRCNCSGKKLED